jgi:hypothetical protein
MAILHRIECHLVDMIVLDQAPDIGHDVLLFGRNRSGSPLARMLSMASSHTLARRAAAAWATQR